MNMNMNKKQTCGLRTADMLTFNFFLIFSFHYLYTRNFICILSLMSTYTRWFITNGNERRINNNNNENKRSEIIDLALFDGISWFYILCIVCSLDVCIETNINTMDFIFIFIFSCHSLACKSTHTNRISLSVLFNRLPISILLALFSDPFPFPTRSTQFFRFDLFFYIYCVSYSSKTPFNYYMAMGMGTLYTFWFI